MAGAAVEGCSSSSTTPAATPTESPDGAVASSDAASITDSGAVIQADATSDGGSSASAQTACETLASAHCKRLTECGWPRPECGTITQGCPSRTFSAGSTLTPDTAMACAAQITALSCAEIVAGELLPCETIGTRGQGEACAWNNQCASGRCSATNGACGSCLGIAQPGEACGDAIGVVCAPGSGCQLGIDVCRKNGQGDPCASGPDCAPGLQCVATDDGGATGACQPLPKPGEPCAMLVGGIISECPQPFFCDWENDSGIRTGGHCRAPATTGGDCGHTGEYGYTTNFLCDPFNHCNFGDGGSEYVAGLKSCVPSPKVGEPCGRNESANYDVDCVPGAYCKLPTADATIGTCAAKLATGEPCDVQAMANTSPCQSGSCSNDPFCTSSVVDGGAPICLSGAASGGMGDTCNVQCASCSSLYQCSKGKCTALNRTSCE